MVHHGMHGQEILSVGAVTKSDNGGRQKKGLLESMTKITLLIIIVQFVKPMSSMQNESFLSNRKRHLIKFEDGLMRGSYTEGEGRFYVIPYAEPPVGSLRFSDPQPKQPWKGIFDGTSMPTCPHVIGDLYRGERHSFPAVSFYLF